MNSQLKFSIIIPIYNVAPWLRVCLDSVRRQTFTDWEVICVDDGSTDDSGLILDEYARLDVRFRVVHQSNAGVSKARNVGLELADGEFVCFLDSDDVWHPELLQEVFDAAQKNPDMDMIGFHHQSFADGVEIVWPKECGSCVELNVLDSAYDCVRLAMFGFAYRREKIEKTRIKDYPIGEDILFLSEMLMKCGRVLSLGRTLYGYRQRGLSLSHTTLPIRALAKLIGYYRDWFAAISSAGRMDRRLLRMYVLGLTEHFTFDLSHFRGGESDDVWQRWFALVDEVATSKRAEFSTWSNFVLWACHVTHSKAVACLLGAFPFWLKKNGVHR